MAYKLTRAQLSASALAALKMAPYAEREAYYDEWVRLATPGEFEKHYRSWMGRWPVKQGKRYTPQEKPRFRTFNLVYTYEGGSQPHHVTVHPVSAEAWAPDWHSRVMHAYGRTAEEAIESAVAWALQRDPNAKFVTEGF